ncbi:uncharacterized protein LOC110017394 [Oryzias latipes]
MCARFPLVPSRSHHPALDSPLGRRPPPDVPGSWMDGGQDPHPFHLIRMEPRRTVTKGNGGEGAGETQSRELRLGRRFIFQQDKDPKQTAESYTEWFKKKRFLCEDRQISLTVSDLRNSKRVSKALQRGTQFQRGYTGTTQQRVNLTSAFSRSRPLKR